MNDVIDAVTNLIRLIVTERALKWSDDDADEHVLLAFSHAESFYCGSGQLRVGRFGENRDFFDEIGVVTEAIAYSVTYILHRVVLIDSDGEVSS